MFTLERTGSRRRVGLVTMVGLILVPLVVAGGFLWANWKADTRLDRVQAAVVNLDEAVKLNGQTVPLGRQLAGGLVSGQTDQNFDWVLSDAADASSGLAAGRYAAVVTIPKTFSAHATSFSKTDVDEVNAATIQVQTSQITGLSDAVVGQAIADAATKELNTQLTEQYLDQIYVGFNTTGKQFATVADAAGKLADGSTQLSQGLTKLDGGAQKLDTGASQLSTGVSQLSGGIGKSATGAAQLAAGAKKLDDNLPALTSGAAANAKGVRQFADGLGQYTGGVTQYTQGVTALKNGIVTTKSEITKFGNTDAATLAKLVPCPTQLPAEACPAFYAGLQAGVKVGTGAATAAIGPATTPKGEQPRLLAGATTLSEQGAVLSSKGTPIAAGATRLSSGAGQLSTGVRGVATGVDGLATGTSQLSTGLAQLAAGGRELSSGASQLATGTSALADGTKQSASGAKQLAAGSTKLADGLEKGKDQIPSYSEPLRTKLSAVVANPVTSERPAGFFADIASTTFLAIIALWIGALATYLVVRAVSSRVLTSMKSSGRLAAEGLLPGVVAAGVQAVVLSLVLRSLLDLSAGQVAALVPFTVLAGLAFVAVNHALVAWFGGVGRFVSVVVLVASAAGAITSAVPAFFDAVQPFLPLTPALEGVRAIASDGTGAGGAVGLTLAWLVIGVAASVLAVARRRVVSPLRVVSPAT